MLGKISARFAISEPSSYTTIHKEYMIYSFVDCNQDVVIANHIESEVTPKAIQRVTVRLQSLPDRNGSKNRRWK